MKTTCIALSLVASTVPAIAGEYRLVPTDSFISTDEKDTDYQISRALLFHPDEKKVSICQARTYYSDGLKIDRDLMSVECTEYVVFSVADKGANLRTYPAYAGRAERNNNLSQSAYWQFEGVTGFIQFCAFNGDLFDKFGFVCKAATMREP